MNSKVSFSVASREYQTGRYAQSLVTLNQLIDVQKDAKTYALLAKSLLKLGFKSDAAKSYSLAAKCEGPSSYEYYKLAARLHFECGEDDEALLICTRNFEKASRDPELAYILAAVFLKRDQRDLIQPLKSVLAASSAPDHLRVAVQLLTNDLHDASNQTLARNILKRFPKDIAARFLHLIFVREFNDFDEAQRHQKLIDELLSQGKLETLRKDHPFYHLHWCGNEDYNRYPAVGIPALDPGRTTLRRELPHTWSGKIRVGYMSSDFWDQHATMKLMQRVLELHDRNKFEIVLFDHSMPERLALNTMDRSTWGKVIDINGKSDKEVQNLIHEEGIDIMIDLKGHTAESRTLMFNLPLAPVHVAWLGFPGSTLGVDIDYVIGDHFVLPDVAKPFYHEKFCRMPESYQPNDPVNRPQVSAVTRAQFGLPEDAFVFASFNGNRKIMPETVASWARILKRAPNSVLWLMANTPRNKENLLKAFQAEGIPSKRIIFCMRGAYEEHMNRIQAADLGIDTFPVNGHTTTSEQLWGGLPVLTMKGTNFASRVSESLLNAIGLPELVGRDLQDYEDMAVALAEQREKVAGYKAHLATQRYIAPLFDAERFCRHLEQAFETMVDRAKRGETPDHFDVPALPARAEPFMTA